MTYCSAGGMAAESSTKTKRILLIKTNKKHTTSPPLISHIQLELTTKFVILDLGVFGRASVKTVGLEIRLFNMMEENCTLKE